MYTLDRPFLTPAAIARPSDIASLANVPASAKIVLLACLKIKGGALRVRLPDETVLRFGDGDAPTAELWIKDFSFAGRVIANGDIGLAEGWMRSEWESPDLAAVLTLLAANAERYMNLFDGGPVGRFVNKLAHAARPNTRAGTKRNVLDHYDLGNDFYAAWLDSSMTYSSALFAGEERDLERAQRAKYRALAEHLALKPGEHVLEIGCGWGGFAEFAAAEYGARVTGITISDEQLRYAQARIARAALQHRVDIRHQDYRDVTGAYDKVASIEMFEAVGEKYWPDYFGKIASVLHPGGRASLQAITIRDDLFQDYRSRTDFIQRYVFPGGMLASPSRMRAEAEKAGFHWRAATMFGNSYAETLAQWARRFKEKWRELRLLGFDERFKRLWLFYLAYCEAGFRSKRIDVTQVALVKP
jgi:cyclopropane-fatty-acyl-phospholipid synthase